MNIKLLYCAVLLHSAIAISAQEPLNLKTQMVTQAAVGKLKDLKALRESAQPSAGMRLSQALLTICAASALVGATNAKDIVEPHGLQRTFLYDASMDGCIPLGTTLSFVCARAEDFNRNMTDMLDSYQAIQDFYWDFYNTLLKNRKTKDDNDYAVNLANTYPNEGWSSQEGSQFKSITYYHYPSVTQLMLVAMDNNNQEYYQWQQSRYQPTPYQPKFINGTLEYVKEPKNPFQTLRFLTHGVYEPQPEKEEKASQQKQKKQEDMQKKLDNAKKRLQRSNQTAVGSKPQRKANGSKRGR